MERARVRALFDDDAAASYDASWPRANPGFEAAIIQRLLGDGSGGTARWLDLGCGAGYHLSRFPGVERAGLDLSPAMLERARAANPDALFFREGDYLEFLPEWQGDWTMVSCLSGAYGYVDSLWDIEQLVRNMVRFTFQGGAVFIPVLELGDVRADAAVGYVQDPDVWGGATAVTGSTWTRREPDTERVHEHLVAPNVEHFVHILVDHFEHIEVVRYPDPAPGSAVRTAVVATKRLAPGAPGPATVAWPEPVAAPAPQPQPQPHPEAHPARVAEVRLDTVPTRWILVEARRRLDPRLRVRSTLRRLEARLRRALD